MDAQTSYQSSQTAQENLYGPNSPSLIPILTRVQGMYNLSGQYNQAKAVGDRTRFREIETDIARLQVTRTPVRKHE